MTAMGRLEHWGNVYATKEETAVSWFQTVPQVSLDLIVRAGLGLDAAIIDIGGGASRLVDHLLAAGYRNLTVLDITDNALEKSRQRLGVTAGQVQWIPSDITAWQPDRVYDIWHDRAVFHFLTDAGDRQLYRSALLKGTKPGSQVIIGTFALDGPEKCSGLPVRRYDAATLGLELGPAFTLMESIKSDHQTPSGNIQRFEFCRFARI